MDGVAKVYYALTKNEAKRPVLTVPKRPGYEGKGVHLSLEGMKRYIKDFKLNDYTHYTELSMSQFEVAPNVYMDPKYNMVMVKTPFSFMVKHIKEM